MADDRYRYRCPCGQSGRRRANPNDAVSDAYAHAGWDRDRTPCPDRVSPSRMSLQRNVDSPARWGRIGSC